MADESNHGTFKQKVSFFKITPLRSASRSSYVWSYFGTLVHDDGQKRRTVGSDNFCKLCLEKALSEDSTLPFESGRTQGVREGTGDSEGLKNYFSTAKRKHTNDSMVKKQLARDFVLWVARDLLPFSIVNGEGLRDFLLKYKVIKSDEDLPDRTTLSRGALNDVYNAMHDHVKRVIQEGPRFLAVTYDMWMDNHRRRSYITFTCHFIDESFELRSMTLSTRNMVERHTAVAIWGEYCKCTEEFGMTTKTITAVTDAGSNMKRAASLADTEHHLCAGHGLHNLVLVDGIQKVPELSDLLRSCRAIVKRVHYKAGQLEEIVEADIRTSLLSLCDVGDAIDDDEADPALLCDESDEHSYSSSGVPSKFTTVKSDTPTRWHSILAMLESLIVNKASLRKLLATLGEPMQLGPEEWSLVGELVEFLKQFRKAVELFSMQRDCTYNTLLVIRSELKSCLEDKADDSTSVRQMKQAMLAKFDYRFPVTESTVTASLLDPRFQNLKVVDEYLTTKGLSKVDFLAAQVLRFVKESDIRTSDGGQPRSSTEDTFAVLAKRHSSGESLLLGSVNAECHALMSTPAGKCGRSTSVLDFWRSAQTQLPWLSCLAKKVLCVPATSTPSERVFSIAGLIVRAKRANLHPLTLDKLIFIHDNYSVCKDAIC
ncbi:zinc finger BED domain-containing protein 4-like [Ornithodoros turicata]|uniref:zinc finger BED domain-containing protein 4-like n=1 Tax=Ornithodoros turicata TaxID=34597 RepID=UPI00313938B6